MAQFKPRRSGDRPGGVAEAKARFSELVQKAMLGREVIVGKANRPVVKIVQARAAKAWDRKRNLDGSRF